MGKNLQFKVSSALKNIVGSDLINDDLIAIFELVKNSYDAHASKVDIEFKYIYSDNPKIIIKDNGKGMNYDDLINKWLFLAYSAKKEGTEEDSFNYRDKINVKRAYAGAKGIGRFSCDRLGHELYLETIKNEPNPKVETLLTDWDKFEGDLKDEFVNINVIHETIENSNYNVNKGTVLEISELKGEWDRKKFQQLKSALAKLINPNTQNAEDIFSVNLIIEDELINDNKEKDKNKKVNGKIENLIFETLDLKTTKIVSKVSDFNKKQIETSLFEGGKLVYKITEENTLENLHNLEFVIYFLNQSAKATFTRRMGMPLIDYGHIFLYKNGLRIYPYGERGEDPLKMDNRKAQGYRRYLGTRETLGYISIENLNEDLRETSSRGDGLIKTKAYVNLVEWFYTTLRRLEKYGIDIIDWGKDLSNDDFIQLDDNAKQSALRELVNNLTKSKNIISFETSPEIFKILDSKQEKSAKTTLSNISKSLESDTFNKTEVLKNIAEVEHKIDNLKNIKEEAEEEAIIKHIENEQLEVNLENEIKKGAFQGALIGTDKERIIGLQHQIYHSSSRINRNVKLLLKHIGIENIDDKTRKYIKTISLEASKINSIANFVTKSNFNLKASEIETDIIDFITDYITEIYLIDDNVIDVNLSIEIIRKFSGEYILKFRPLEITTIFDNIISNSEKAEAENIKIEFSIKNKRLQIDIIDNGKGIASKNINKVFEMGYSTTNGSGIGLFQVHDIVTNNLNGKITILSEENKQTHIQIII